MAATKSEFTTDFQEFDTPDHNAKSAKLTRTIGSVNLGLTVLALLASVTILGTAGDTLSSYNNTTLGSEYIVSLWPADFDIRPTTALVVCSAIVLIASATSLIANSVPAVRYISCLRAPLIDVVLHSRLRIEPFSRAHLPSSCPLSASSLHLSLLRSPTA